MEFEFGSAGRWQGLPSVYLLWLEIRRRTPPKKNYSVRVLLNFDSLYNSQNKQHQAIILHIAFHSFTFSLHRPSHTYILSKMPGLDIEPAVIDDTRSQLTPPKPQM
jgi:hypothetical protein